MQTQNCNFCQNRVHPDHCPASCKPIAAGDTVAIVCRGTEPVRSINSGGIAVPADFIYV